MAGRAATPPTGAPQPPPSAADALEPLKRMSENFRTRLRDPWNLRALTYTETSSVDTIDLEKRSPFVSAPASPLIAGAPREQGHYSFMLTDLYLLPLLSGLRIDKAHPPAHQRLELAPQFAPPFTLPVLFAGRTAVD